MTLAPFSEVVRRHGPMVLRVCRSMLGPTDADDAWSDTFIAAMRAYPELDETANVGGWLVTIARNKCIDAMRRRERTPTPTDHATVYVIDPSATAEPVDELDEGLRTALNGLSERQRIAVIAHHVAGLPHAEVAAVLDTTPAAARRSAADGIAKLRSAYRRDLDR